MPALTTISALAPQIAAGAVTPLDLVENCLARINQLESDLGAWVLVDRDGARSAALEIGRQIAAGNYLGPLCGIPIGIKDIVDVAGMPTRAGSALTDPNPVASDAQVVARLRAAGAIILGKTVTTEFACFDPPATRNPWNFERTPGGSSSGSAVAVATGMCLAAVGSQTGGSITRPASYCGVAGCKPTHGLVRTDGVFPVSDRLDHVGPIARSAADLAVMLSAMAHLPRGASSTASHERPPRLGLVEAYFMENATPDVGAAFCHALRTLSIGGARVHAVPLPAGFAHVHAMHRRIMAHDAAAVHRERYQTQRDGLGQSMQDLIAEGLAVDEAAYDEAVQYQAQFRTAVDTALADFDALVVPATTSTAPARSTTGDPRFNSPWSFAGVPTVSLPSALSPDGLPISIQLIGRRAADLALLDTAIWCQQELCFDRVPRIVQQPVVRS